MKNIKFLIVLFFVTLLSGCVFNEPKYINLKSKPNLYYYSNEVYEKLKSNQDYSLKVFDVNYYEYHDVSKEDLDILPSFLKSLNSNNYVISLNLDDLKVKYKLINNQTFFNLFLKNETRRRIHPKSTRTLSVYPASCSSGSRAGHPWTAIEIQV